jgi:hypothetical protein
MKIWAIFNKFFRRKNNAVMNIDEIKIIDNDSHDVLKFECTDLPQNFNEKFVKIPDSNFSRNLSSQLLGAGIQTGAMANIAGSGFFKATIDPALLSQYSSGTISSIVKVNGKIVEHAGFQAIPSAQVFAPILVFQLASICTGQYYLNGINSQLSLLQERVNELIRLHHLERKSYIETVFNTLQEFANKTCISSADIHKLADFKFEVKRIRVEYYHSFNDYKLEELAKAYNDNFYTSTMVSELTQKFEDSQLEMSSDMIHICDILIRIIILLEIKLYSQYDKYNLKQLDELISSARKLQPPDWSHVTDKINDCYTMVFDLLFSIENSAWIKKDLVVNCRNSFRQRQKDSSSRIQNFKNHSSNYDRHISQLHNKYCCIFDVSTNNFYLEKQDIEP